MEDHSFQLFVDRISGRLLKAAASEFETVVADVLGDIGEEYQLDRIVLRLFTEDRNMLQAKASWLRDTDNAVTNRMIDEVPWLGAQILRGESIKLSSRADLSPEAQSERQIFEAESMNAVQIVPLFVDKHITGTLTFSKQKEYEWPDALNAEFCLLSDLLGCAYFGFQFHARLRDSEERYRAVVQDQMEFIVRWHPDGTRTWVSDSYCSYFQQTRENLVGTKTLPFGLDLQMQSIIDTAKTLTPQDPAITAEYRVELRSGEIAWHEWTDRAIFDDQGKLTEIQSVGRDVTDRKLITDALAESESRFRGLVGNTTDWIWESNIDLDLTYYNRQLEMILGYDTAEIEAISIDDLLHPQDLKDLRERLPMFIAERKGWQRRVVRFRHKDGSYKFFESSASPVFDQYGEMCGFHGVDRDVSGQYFADEQIRSSEEIIHTLFESANDAILLLDHETVTDCNPMALKVFETTRDELIGKRPWDLSPAAQADGVSSKKKARNLLKKVRSGKPLRFEWVHITKDGSTVYADISLNCINLRAGTRTLAILRDITESKRTHEALEHQADFQRFIAEISAAFMSIQPEEADEKIIELLEKIGLRYDLARAGMWWFSESQRTFSRTHGWDREGEDLPAAPEVLKISDAPWAIALVLSGKVFVVNDLKDLPADFTADRAFLRQLEFASFLAVPLMVGSYLRGACTFATSKQRTWDDNVVDELQHLSSTLAIAFTHVRAAAEISRRAEFQGLLATLSLDLLRCGHDEIIERCRLALENIGEDYEFDSVDLWWYPIDGETTTRLIAWDREGIPFPLPSDSVPISQQPWSRPLLLAGEIIKIEDVDCMPAEANLEQGRAQDCGYKSLLYIPTKSEDEVFGSCVCEFATLKRCRWSDRTLQELQLLCSPLTNAATAFLAAKEISRHAEFQSRLAQLSTSLLSAAPEETDVQFKQALRSIGLAYKLDSIGMWWTAKEHDGLRRRTGWRRETLDNSQNCTALTLADAPWIAEFVSNGKILKLDDVGEMPAEAHIDQSVLQMLGFSSFLAVPMRISDAVVGFCGFSTIEQRPWGDETVQEFRILADFLANASSRLDAANELSLREQDLARSQRVAHVGSFTLIADTSDGSNAEISKITMSEEAVAMFGFETAENSPDLVLSRIHPDDRDQVIDIWRETTFAKGRQSNLAYRVIRPDGAMVYMEISGKIDHIDDSGVVTVFGTCKDVTSWVEANQKLANAFTEIERLKDQLHEENLYLREEVRAAHGFDKIIGQEPKLKRVLVAAEKVAPTDVTVLITGETGTGKELVAQAIHDLSYRKDKAMVTLNCAALSASLIESELFGHEKGAFTGAHAKRKGRFELADGGTLFLDEIGELSGELQAKLLRVLQAGQFERLGGTETLHVDVRFISATNQDLKRAVDTGEFRADLYYRINSFPIEMPPLRDRPDDIPILAEHFVRKHAERIGKKVHSISDRMIHYLKGRPWPGNVRELEGFIQRALISTTGPILDYLEDGQNDVAAYSSLPTATVSNLRATERHHIANVLEQTKWRIEGKHGAAAALGIPPSSLRSKMKRLEINRPS